MNLFGPEAVIAAAALLAILVLALAGLRAWHDWLDFQRQALGRREGAAGGPLPGARIELADLRERVRKLEAIAAGVDL